MSARAHHTGGDGDRLPEHTRPEGPMRLIVVDVLDASDLQPPTDLARAIHRMYPALARIAVAIGRLHVRRKRPAASRPEAPQDR